MSVRLFHNNYNEEKGCITALFFYEEESMLTGILIGAASGFTVAALCAACYWLGQKGESRYKQKQPDKAEEEQNALMKKYEAIMGYDPYGEHV